MDQKRWNADREGSHVWIRFLNERLRGGESITYEEEREKLRELGGFLVRARERQKYGPRKIKANVRQFRDTSAPFKFFGGI